MKRLFNLDNLTVKASLIIVLLFFIVALIAGAALGILSLRQNNQVLQQMLQHEQASDTLNRGLAHYQRSQILLAHALASHVQRVDEQNYTMLSAWVEKGAGAVQAIDQNTQTLLTQAGEQLNQSKELFKRYADLHPVDASLLSGHERVVRAYHSLVTTGIDPLATALQQGRIADFNAIFGSRIPALEKDLYSQAELQMAQQQAIETAHSYQQAKQYALVKQLVGVAMVFIVLLSFAVYWFLNRMVLYPLGRMDRYFTQIAQGNLTEPINTDSSNEIGVLFKSLNRMQQELERMVHSVRHGVEQIRVNAMAIHDGTTDLNRRSEQQAAALQETAASMEQLASTVRLNTENAFQANQVAQQSSDIAQKGGEAVASVVHTMNGMSDSADKISDIVNVIDSIAFQTNILALNAAVEAARAGEQGRGFAVVAAEVRSLAQRSAQAAQEIKTLINASFEQVQKGSAQVNEAGQVVSNVVQAVAGVSALMSEISEASTEQSQGIDQVNLAVVEMDSVVQQNAYLVQKTALSLASLQDQAEQLAAVVATFKTTHRPMIDTPLSAQRLEGQMAALDQQIYITER